MPYAPDGILFDGITDHMLRAANLTGVVDGKQGTVSFWIRIDALDLVNRQTIFAHDAGVNMVVQFLEDDTLRINGRNSAGDIVLRLDTTKVFAVDSYLHVVASWDLAVVTAFVYVDDVLATLATETIVDDLIDYDVTPPGWGFGGETGKPSEFLIAGLSDFYFSTEFVDLSVDANRRKFIDADGMAVYLGDTGELPTGTAAAMYIRGIQTNQALNSGTGGDFVSQATQVPGETPGPTEPNPGNAPVPYLPKGILFDGTTDFMLRGTDLTGIVDGKEGTVSFWLRLDGGDGARQDIFGSVITTIKLIISREVTTNKLLFIARNSAGTDIMRMETLAAHITSASYIHVLAAWDLAAATVLLFVDDVADIAALPTATDDVIDYGGATEWSLGAKPDVAVGDNKLDGALSDFYFITEFVDISVEANRRDFIDSSGDPVFLGDDGTLPTGTFPEVYLSGEFLDQGFNGGSGGDFVSQATQVPGETPGPAEPGALPGGPGDDMRHLARRAGRFHRFFRG